MTPYFWPYVDRLFRTLFLLPALAMLSGCGMGKLLGNEPPPPPPAAQQLEQLQQLQILKELANQPTEVTISFGASPGLNPAPDGRPSPLVVRLFELKSPVSFQSSDFFSLYEQPEATLGADLLNSEEFIIKPGDTRFLERTLKADTRHVGLLAAYRDLNRAVWSTVMPVEPQRTTHIRVDLEPTVMTARVSEE